MARIDSQMPRFPCYYFAFLYDEAEFVKFDKVAARSFRVALVVEDPELAPKEPLTYFFQF